MAAQVRVDVAARADLISVQHDLDRSPPARRQHQERRRILARQTGIDYHPAAVESTFPTNGDGWTAARRFGRDAQSFQRRHERADRAFLHVSIAGDDDLPVHQGCSRGEEAGRRSSVAEKQGGGRRGKVTRTGDYETGGVWLVDHDAHGSKRFGHIARVITFQGAAQMTRTAREGSQQQRPIGNGFGARRSDSTSQRVRWRYDSKDFRH